MATPSTTQYFEAVHNSTIPPTDPNLFSATDIVTGSFDSAAISNATSKAVSTVNAAAPDSTSISQAKSQAVSAASVGSVADSKALSGSSNTSIADSKAVSGSVNTSVADSKAVSAAFFASAPSAIVSTADSKAVSTAVIVPSPALGRTVATLAAYVSNNAKFNVKDFGAVGDGVADDRTAVNAAINAANTAGGGDVDLMGTLRIGSALSTASNARLNFLNGATLAPDGGVTVTINAPIPPSTGRRQIFGGAGTVLFGSSSGITEAYPEWFGAKGDSDGAGGGTDDSSAFTKAVTALGNMNKTGMPGGSSPSSTGALDMGVTRYRMSSAFSPPITHAFTLRGKGGRRTNAGEASTSLVFDSGVAGVKLIASAESVSSGWLGYTLLEGFEIVAVGKTSAVEGFYSEVPFIYRNFTIRGFKSTGLHVKADNSGNPPTNANRYSASDGSVSLCDGTGVWVEGNDTNAGSFINVGSTNNLGYGFRDDSKYGIQCFNCEGANNTLGNWNNVQVADANFERQTTLIGCYDGDGGQISVLRYPAAIVGGVLAFQTKSAAALHNDAAIWPPVHGQWTPTLIPATSGSVAYNATFTGGRWTKIGRQVIIHGEIVVAALSSPVGALTIQGLSGATDEGGHTGPYLTPANRQTLYTAFAVNGIGYNNTITGGLAGRVLPGSLSFELNKMAAGGITPFTGADLIASTTQLFFTIMYTVGD
jgi:hypothetical protein